MIFRAPRETATRGEPKSVLVADIDEFHDRAVGRREACDCASHNRTACVGRGPSREPIPSRADTVPIACCGVEFRGCDDAASCASCTRRELSQHTVPIVIANALSLEDASFAREARAYMNEISAAGYLELEVEVQLVLDGRVSADDLEG